ncbi:hypothetical protein NDU88_002950 [Pleurodeles waltl]|uniref:Uncharacterized protein n=1 Tax=Pleurodeles waltl TaxID=8319 RepID=A0AAV7MYU2_PLEWA|nr:hypothetical protein NDU88_002950 [Pleurodeles waltl]
MLSSNHKLDYWLHYPRGARYIERPLFERRSADCFYAALDAKETGRGRLMRPSVYNEEVLIFRCDGSPSSPVSLPEEWDHGWKFPRLLHHRHRGLQEEHTSKEEGWQVGRIFGATQTMVFSLQEEMGGARRQKNEIDSKRGPNSGFQEGEEHPDRTCQGDSLERMGSVRGKPPSTVEKEVRPGKFSGTEEMPEISYGEEWWMLPDRSPMPATAKERNWEACTVEWGALRMRYCFGKCEHVLLLMEL